MSQLDYVKALLVRRPAYLEQVRIPRIEREMPVRSLAEGKLRAFRDVTLYPDDGYLPITYPHVAAFPAHFKNMLDARFPLRQTGIIHIRSKFVQLRPIGGGEEIRMVASIDGQRDTDKGWEFDLVTEVYAKEDKVWQGWATMLSRRPGGTQGKKPPPQLAVEAPGAISEPWRVSPTVARAYAWASGDLNPIHLSPVTAKLFGFPRALAHGMWSLSRIAGRHQAVSSRPMTELYAEFKLPLFLPGEAVHQFWPEPNGGLSFKLLDGKGEKPHVTGSLKRHE